MSTNPPGPTTGPPPHDQQWPPPPNRPPWRLVRRERGRVIAGVATGLADSLGIDVLVVRVLWVVFALASLGVGVAAYVICWIVFPSDEAPAPINRLLHDHEHQTQSVGYIVAVVLLGIGLLIVFVQLLSLHPLRHGGGVAFATLLIGAGVAVLLLRKPDDRPAPPSAFPPPAPASVPTNPTNPTDPTNPAPNPTPDGGFASPVAGAEPDSAAGAAGAAAPTTGDATSPQSRPPQALPSAFATTPGATVFDPAAPAPTATAWTQYAPWPAPPAPRRPPRPPRPRSFLTPLTLSLLLIGAGVVTLLDNNGSAHLTAAEILAGGLCVVGVALVLSTWFGRARLLIPLGILLLLATIPAATIDVPLTGGVGDHQFHPLARSEIQAKYEMGVGRLDIDLTQVPLAGHVSHVHAQLGIGELAIDVPSTVRVVVHAHVGAGSTQLFGSNEGGWPEQQARTAPGTRAGELDLDLRVGAGNIIVRRFDATGAETIYPAGPIPAAVPAAPSLPSVPTTPETVR